MKYLLYVFLASLLFVFTFLVPPFQKPDEPVHFYRVITLFHGEVSCDYSTGKPHFILPLSVYNFPKTMFVQDIPTLSIKFPISLYKQAYPWTQDREKTDNFSYCTLPWYAYIPQVIVTALSIPFNNLLLTFYGMRMMNALLFFLFVILVQKISPRPYKKIFWLFAFIPMVLHQATAVSYDAPSLMIGMLVCAYFLSLISRTHVSLKSAVLFTIILTLFNAVKGGYYPTFLLLIPIVLKVKIRWSPVTVFAVACVGSIVSAVIIREILKLQLLVFLSHANLFSGHQITLSDPLYFLRVLGNTLSSDSDALLHQIIGQFGWLDYSVSSYIFVTYFLAIGYVLASFVHDFQEKIHVRILILFWIIIISAIILISFVFYTQASPPAYYMIVSLQGRYFLPLFPLFLVAVGQTSAYVKKRHGARWVCMSILLGLYLFSLGRSIYVRYFDYSKSIINYNPLIEQIHKNPEIVKMWTTLTVDSEKKFIIQTDPSIGLKISGFQVVPANEFDVTMPYAYAIADATCTHVFTRGYLDRIRGERLKHIRMPDDPVYTQYFPIIRVTEGSVCIIVRPTVPVSKYNIPLKIYTDKDKPLIRLLYLIQ